MAKATPTRRAVLRGAGGLALAGLAPSLAQSQRRIVLDDASGLSATPVARHWTPAATTPEAEFIAALRRELAEAARR
jgi:hypothetical protein